MLWMLCLHHTGWLSLLPHQHVIWPVHWAAAPLKTPRHTHCSQTPLTVSLCLSQRGFFSPCFLPSMTSHLGYPSGTSEKLSSPKCHCLTFSSPHTLGLSREVQEDGSVTAVLQDSLDERYLVPSSCGDLSEFHQPPNSPVTLSEEHLLCSAMNPSGEYTHCKENKG
jgi:hypothetical protein